MFNNFLKIKFKRIVQKLENHNYFIYRSFQFVREHILKKNFWKPYISYSQLGEDLAIQKLSRNYDCKTFLDIGSYHPFRYSNTRLLKRNQWRGVHVDASKASIELFKKVYPKDISINAIITNSKKLSYEEFKPNEIFAKNRFTELKMQNLKNFSIDTKKKIKEIEILSSIDLYNRCNKYFGKNLKKIGFLNIDIEGLELDFLKKWPLEKCIFQFICIENQANSLEEILKSDTHIWLSNNGYRLVYFFKFSSIYEYFPK